MEASTIVERDFTALGMLFNLVINDLKNSTPVFEDFIIKSTKLHTQLKATIIASTAFLNSFQQIADMATSARGGTKDIGSALTRLCLRQRSVESHLKTFTSSIMDCLIIPLQERLEEWKKINAQLDKEHSKEYKKYRQELKKRPSDNNLTGQGLILYKDGQKESIYQSQQSMATLKLKKLRLSSISSNGSQPEPIYASMDLNDKLIHFEQQEKNAVRRALIEERSRYCILVSFLKNVIEEELLITQETSHLQEVMDNLNKLTVDPYQLPASSELVISDIKLGNSKGQYSSLNETLKNNSEIYASTQQLRQQQLQNQQQSSQVIYGHLLNQQQSTQSINQPNHIHLQNQNLNSTIIPPHQQPPQLPSSQPPQLPTGQLHSNHPNNLNNQLNHLNNQTPPSSPSSFSSRKSSCCSISSFNSSSSGSTHSPSLHHHHLAGHHHHHFNNNRYSQNGHIPIRIPSIASHTSSDSGFASNADTLSLNQVPSLSEHHSGTLNTRNWINNDQTDQINQLNSARPHTISASCYEKQRPALSSETFVEPIYESKTLNLRNRNNLTLVNDTISKSNNGHTTVIKVESKQLSSYDHQQKFIEELDNVINNQSKNNSSPSNSKSNSPPQPPTRKSSVISLTQTVDQNGKLNNEISTNDDTLCSEGSIGSITPTNPTQQDLNLYRLSNVEQDKSNSYLMENQKQQQQCLNDELTATLTRQNKNNNKLSTSCTNLINTTLSTYHNNQLSLTNLNQMTTINKAAPPPPIRRTSSISNPNAITLGTLAKAGVSTYEEIKTLTLTRNKKNTTNYATCDDVSRLGINNSNKNTINNNQNQSHYATFIPNNNSNQDIYGINYNNCFNTYSGNRTNYRINSCSTLQAHDKLYSELNSNDLDKNDEKEKTINQLNQLRSEYQQAKNLFENLECNQHQTKSTTDIYSSNNLIDSSQNDFQAYLTQKHQQLTLETDSGCSSNNGSSNNDSTNGSQTSGSSISGQISGHISRMSTVRREFLETLNAKLSSPLVKSSPKMKRRSLSIGHDSEYDYDHLNESLSSNKTISSNLTNDKNNKAENGHFSQFMRLVQTNYAKITRSPELTRKFSANLTSSTNQTANSLLNASYNSSLSNILFGGNNTTTTTNNPNSIIKAEMAKEIASIAIKKKQTNSYPTNCSTYEVLSSFQNNKKQEPIYSTSCLNNANNLNNHTTTIQVDNNLNNNMLKSTNCQEIYQPAQNLQLKANNIQNQNNQHSESIRRYSQPNMGIKIVATNRQNQPPNQLNLNQQINQYQTQKSNSNDNVQKSFLQNANEKANFLSKLDAKLSPTKNVSPTKIVSPNYSKQQQMKTKNEFDNQVARVDAWLNKLSPEEETNCRENLLDQIRKGKQLRKVEKIDDRSAPKI